MLIEVQLYFVENSAMKANWPALTKGFPIPTLSYNYFFNFKCE